MKAVVQDGYGPVEVLELRDVDVPVPGDDDVLVRVRAAGVDPSVWHIMEGRPYLVRIMGFGFRAPKRPVRGLDVAGRVEAVGRNVTGFQVGDEVFGVCRGSFAEYATAPASQLAHKPARLTPEQAAAVPVSGCTALQALRDKGRIRAGQRVLVIGAGGGVGTYAVQLAKAHGADVTGVCSTGKVDFVRSLGAHHVVDYTRDDLGDPGHRYDLVVDCAGNRPLSRLRRVLAPAGTLVIIGGEGGGRLLGGVQRLLGAALLSRFGGRTLTGLMAQDSGEDVAALGEFIESGKVTPALDRTFALGEVPEAVRYVRAGRARGKVVISV